MTTDLFRTDLAERLRAVAARVERGECHEDERDYLRWLANVLPVD